MLPGLTGGTGRKKTDAMSVFVKDLGLNHAGVTNRTSTPYARGRRQRGHVPQQGDAFNVPQQSGEPLVIGVTMSPRVGGESETWSESPQGVREIRSK